jgi:iron complex transport system substrate-binding protein
MTHEWTDPPFYGGHWVAEQVERPGGQNVMGGLSVPSRRTTWDQILETDPDVLVVMCYGYGLEENTGFARELLVHVQARGLRAVQSGQVWAVDANTFFSRPSLGVVRELLLGREVIGSSRHIMD